MYRIGQKVYRESKHGGVLEIEVSKVKKYSNGELQIISANGVRYDGSEIRSSKDITEIKIKGGVFTSIETVEYSINKF